MKVMLSKTNSEIANNVIGENYNQIVKQAVKHEIKLIKSFLRIRIKSHYKVTKSLRNIENILRTYNYPNHEYLIKRLEYIKKETRHMCMRGFTDNDFIHSDEKRLISSLINEIETFIK